MSDTSPEALLAWCEEGSKNQRALAGLYAGSGHVEQADTNSANAVKWEALAALVRSHQALQGCTGGCSCEVFISRHEAAMALYRTMEQQQTLRAEVEKLRIDGAELSGDGCQHCTDIGTGYGMAIDDVLRLMPERGEQK